MKNTIIPTAPMRPGSKPPPAFHLPKSTQVKKKDKVKQAQQQARSALVNTYQGVSPAGSIVWSDPVSGWTKPAHEVRQAFIQSGLDPDVLLPTPPDYGTAFSRSILAIRPMCQGRGYTLLAAGNGPNGESRYSVVAVQRNGVVETEDRATVFCPRDGTAPYVERTTHDPRADEIAAWIVRASDERYNTYTSDDVRQAVVRTLDHYGAVPLRNAQPFIFYWCAEAGVMMLTQVGNVLTHLGWGSIDSYEGRMTQANIATAAKAVNATLEGRLKDFADEADKFANNAEGMRPSTIERRMQEAKDIKEKAGLYRTILGAAVESVDDRIKAVEASLMQTLGICELAHAAE